MIFASSKVKENIKVLNVYLHSIKKNRRIDIIIKKNNSSDCFEIERKENKCHISTG